MKISPFTETMFFEGLGSSSGFTENKSSMEII